MSDPLKPGEPLAPPSGPPRAGRGGPPSSPRQSKRRRGRLARFISGVKGGLLGVFVLACGVGAVVGYGVWHHYSANLPDVDGLRSYQPPVMSRVFAGDGRLVAELAAERRLFVPFSAIPEMVTRAFVSAEDQNFWVHKGVDPLAILRAAVFDLGHQGRRPIGASTITQQVAKTMLLDNTVSVSRKVREALLAMRIEESLTKQRILELYLNEIYLGLGSYGVAAAAQTYFNKPLDQLTLAEAAFLAALPKAPNNYNPFKYPDAAKARRDWVLDRMVEDRVITAAQAEEAKAQPIIPSEFRRPAPPPGSEWFTEEVRRQLIQQFGQDVTTQGGLMVRTSLDPVLQRAAEKAVRNGLIAYDRKNVGWRGAVTHIGSPGKDWAGPLAAVPVPAGLLQDWRLAVVLNESESEAKVGWLEPGELPNSPQQQRTGTLELAELAWARPVKDGKPGPAPRKIADVVRPGDVIIVQPAPSAKPQAEASSGQTHPLPSPPVRVSLQQIPQVQGALVSIDPSTGRVLAMVGGWSYEQSQFNRATQAQRQPGSSFKPFVYLTALERGISPSQRFMDAPIVIATAEGRWRPGNFEGTFGGPTPLRIALEQSLNLVTLHVAQRVGMQAVANTAIAFHEVDNMPRVLPAALGAVQTTVLKEAGAYASIDAGGREVTPTLIDSVQDRDGHVVWRPEPIGCEDCSTDAAAAKPPLLTDDRKQIADPQSVFQLITMMEGVVQRGTGVPVAKDLGRPIAGKTGTTQDFSDAWFGGFTPDLVTVVWVGYDNPITLGDNETGAAVAGPIWHDYMAAALKNRPVLDFVEPPGVTMTQWSTGRGVVTDAFKPDQVPGASSPVGVASQYGSGGGTQDSERGTASGGVDTSLGGLY